MNLKNEVQNKQFFPFQIRLELQSYLKHQKGFIQVVLFDSSM